MVVKWTMEAEVVLMVKSGATKGEATLVDAVGYECSPKTLEMLANNDGVSVALHLWHTVVVSSPFPF